MTRLAPRAAEEQRHQPQQQQRQLAGVRSRRSQTNSSLVLPTSDNSITTSRVVT